MMSYWNSCVFYITLTVHAHMTVFILQVLAVDNVKGKRGRAISRPPEQITFVVKVCASSFLYFVIEAVMDCTAKFLLFTTQVDYACEIYFKNMFMQLMEHIQTQMQTGLEILGEFFFFM